MGIGDFLRRRDEADLLRLATTGSVDDGKSTLIGRLLHETRSLCEDHVASVERDSRLADGEIDYSLFTDGLSAEREQGITIDVAYRYFSTPQRRFIIADTPGHVQYTRNMVTGASNADLAILLVDARQGVVTQSRRHAFIASLLGIPHVIVAINKMDLVDYSEEVFETIKEDYEEFAARLNVKDLSYVPVSALKGDNVVQPSDRMPWYQGGTLLFKLENAFIAGDRNLIDLRFPVQYVMRPDQDYRGYAGTVESGVLRRGDEIVVLPSGRSSRVVAIDTFDGPLDEAAPFRSIVVRLEDDIDVSRGDLIVHSKNVPSLSRELDAMLIWMDEQPFVPDKTYVIRHATSEVRGLFFELGYRIDPDTLHREEADKLELNDIGRVGIKLYSPLACDDYLRNRRMGSFVVVHPVTNRTVGAGLVMERGRGEPGFGGVTMKRPASLNLTPTSGQITVEDRSRMLGQKPTTIWLTGLSGSGKSTLAYEVERSLTERGHLCYVLDGDNVRTGLNSDLAFEPHERKENIRRVAEVAALFNEAGVIVISAFISPFREDRRGAREIIGEKRFIEVHVDAPLEVCEERDPKGLYQKARRGDIPDFTGISSPYEPPERPDLRIRTDQLSPSGAAAAVLELLEKRGLLRAR